MYLEHREAGFFNSLIENNNSLIFVISNIEMLQKSKLARMSLDKIQDVKAGNHPVLCSFPSS